MEQEQVLQLNDDRLTTEQLRYYLQISGLKQKLTDIEINRFIAFADEFKLNPYKREIHCYIDGWSLSVEGVGNDMKAVVEIHRKDWSNPFRHEVFFSEAAQKNDDGALTSFWKKMPRFQLKKTAISQAFRWAFSDELGGLPYDASELPIRGSSIPASTNEEQDRKILGDRRSDNQTETPQVTIVANDDPFLALESFLKANEETLTKKLCEWIESKLQDERTENKARSLLTYAQKYVRDQNEPSNSENPHRTHSSRYYRTRNTPRIPVISQNAVHPAH